MLNSPWKTSFLWGVHFSGQVTYPGPRIFACGPILDGPEPLWPDSIVVDTTEEAIAAVNQLAADGLDCIKVYSKVDAEILDEIRAAARDPGLPGTG